MIYLLDFKNERKLRYVNIYFSSPTYEKIKKDERANFETKLSAIGGTMGLCAGFSILSAVEIFIFIVESTLGKIWRNIYSNKRHLM